MSPPTIRGALLMYWEIESEYGALLSSLAQYIRVLGWKTGFAEFEGVLATFLIIVLLALLTLVSSVLVLRNPESP